MTKRMALRATTLGPPRKAKVMNSNAAAVLGRELWEVIRRQPESGYANGAQANTDWFGDRERSVLWDRQIHLENSITMSPAETAADALAQLVVAYSMLTRIVDDYPDPVMRAEPLGGAHATAAFRYEHFEFKRHSRALARCLYSICRYFEVSTGLSADEFGACFYMPIEDNPFRLEATAKSD